MVAAWCWAWELLALTTAPPTVHHHTAPPFCVFGTLFFTFTTITCHFPFRKRLPGVLSAAALLLFVLIRDTYEEVTRVSELMSNDLVISDPVFCFPFSRCYCSCRSCFNWIPEQRILSYRTPKRWPKCHRMMIDILKAWSGADGTKKVTGDVD